MPGGQCLINVDPQLTSRLVQAPYDVRREIFKYLIPQNIHVYLDHDQLRLSECLVYSQATEEQLGRERPTDVPDGNQDEHLRHQAWARRLMSPWGPHSICEEALLGSQISGQSRDVAADALLRTCRLINSDIFDLMSCHTSFAVGDIATLDALCSIQRSCEETGLLRLQTLNVVLRLPLSVVAAIELRSVGKSSQLQMDGRSIDVDISQTEHRQAEMWLGLSRNLNRLASLKTLHVWVDHDRKEDWWNIDEKAILSPFASFASRSDVKVLINLPSHAADDESIEPFNIHRRDRQTYFSYVRSDGQLDVRFVQQFPLMREFGEFGEMTYSECDEWERRIWKQGLDVRKDLEDLANAGLCSVGPI
ncbi:hypothetical protein FB567DRAFT_532640 [Paraphoma chrysanthemicola]|uniref:DUF7730 domain-containing protein n=1 Tax=Paraphoma chrysanthemicola TaxID=798071 RepID=A0A8K0VUZ3_9PLEO|nr:hypothetical protein FB567DRAFT_532640 [Paraphoma chrysanthemicola]